MKTLIILSVVICYIAAIWVVSALGREIFRNRKNM